MNTNLYIARRENRLTQKEVAKKLGIHPQTYYEKESGKKQFTIREGLMLAKIFKCTLNDLFQTEMRKEVNQNDTRTAVIP